MAYLKFCFPSHFIPAVDPTSLAYDFSIKSISVYMLELSIKISCTEEIASPVEALVLSGYLSPTPTSPTIAISISMLELYCLLQLHKLSFSVKVYVKVICDLYKWPFQHCYCTTLANVDDSVAVALIKNACPPCRYKLQDEPELKFSCMLVFDGNSSLSQMTVATGHQVADLQVFWSDYFLDSDYVDLFANRVGCNTEADNGSLNHDNSDNINVAFPSTVPLDMNCTENWKAVAADSKKKSWRIFEETSIFASACWHGMILWIVDMIQSGKLFKYPLAMVDKVLSLSTMINSTSLSSKFWALKSCMCIDAFHGYSHNYGSGLEDFETMEYIFSILNQLASITCYSSPYTHQLAINAFFRQWNEDCYLNLGQTLYRNYAQVLQIIQDETEAIEQAKISLGVSSEDLASWRNCHKESDWDTHAIAYVELLQKLRALKYTWKLETVCCVAGEYYVEVLQEVIALEYVHALKNLQCLVVLWLFELHKLKLSQTAIQNAVKVYNHVAIKIAHPTLDWSQVSHYAFLEDVLRNLEAQASPIFGAVLEYCQHCHCINAHVLAHLQYIYVMSGFSGNTTPGIWESIQPVTQEIIATTTGDTLQEEHHNLEEDIVGQDVEDLEEEVTKEVGRIVSYITELPTLSM
ncbi:hypothetical protein J3A83DRAFT_4356133 [Scleroderma citrinum]